MPLPPVTTIAACGSIITAFKSGWELSRMIKKKDQEKRLDSQARGIIYDLRQIYLDGLMDQRTFDKWYDRLLGAIAEKDGPELQKIKAHINLIHRDKARVTRRNTHANTSSIYVDEKRVHRTRARSVDKRYSSRGPPPVYTVEEYEEEKRRPTQVDTVKAQRDYYYAHALPSPYRGELEYTPEDDEFDRESPSKDSRRDRDRGRGRDHRYGHGHGHGHGHRRDHRGSSRSDSYRSHSNSTVDRGRTRSRSVHTEKRVSETSSSDAGSEDEGYHDRRRGAFCANGGGAGGRGHGAGRGGGR